MTKVEGNTWDSFSQFLFAYEFWVMLPQVPDNRGNIISALMVGYKNAGPVGRDLLRIFESKVGPRERSWR